MHIFGRRRKESSQPSSSSSAASSPAKSNALSILSASLPRTYRQQNGSSNGLTGSKKDSNCNAALPAIPDSHDLLKENAAPSSKPRAHHATAPASGNGQYHTGGGVHINELGQIQHARPSTDSSNHVQQPAFMVNAGGAGQQHHQTGADKQSLPPIPRDSSSKHDLNLKALPTLKIANRRMSTGSIPSIDALLTNNRATDTAELQVRQSSTVVSIQVFRHNY